MHHISIRAAHKWKTSKEDKLARHYTLFDTTSFQFQQQTYTRTFFFSCKLYKGHHSAVATLFEKQLPCCPPVQNPHTTESIKHAIQLSFASLRLPASPAKKLYTYLPFPLQILGPSHITTIISLHSRPAIPVLTMHTLEAASNISATSSSFVSLYRQQQTCTHTYFCIR